jgi:hypothetical protein
MKTAKSFLANPRTAVVAVFSWTFIWLILGCLDYFIFSQPGNDCSHYFGWPIFRYPDSQELIPWTKDIIGHWLLAFLCVASTALLFGDKRADYLIDDDLRKEINHSIDRHMPHVFMIFGTICLFLFLQNMVYVSMLSSKLHWTAKACNWILPGLIAFMLFCVAMFSLMVAASCFGEKLFIMGMSCERLKSYSITHQDRMFGLSTVGDSIVWSSVLIILGTFPMLIFQVTTKEDLSVTIFLAPVVVFILIYYLSVRPLWAIYDKLNVAKLQFYQSSNRNYQDLKQKLNNCDDSQIDRLKIQLEEAEKAEQFALSLTTLPLTKPARLTGIITFISTVVMMLINVLKAFGYLH